jgi:type I restriction-modification system DNA methylase subunit
MLALEKENTRLKGALSKDYARPALDKTRLGGVIDLIGNIKLHNGDSQDILGLVYEYFLSQFASKEGKKGGELLKDDVRWQFGVPPTGNANYAWIQHTAAPLFVFFMIILYITLYFNNQESRKDHPL